MKYLSKIFCFFLTTLIIISCNKSEKIPAIYVPTEGGFSEAWQKVIPQISDLLGKNIEVREYKSPEDFARILKNPDRHNVLAFEVPVTGSYHLALFAKDGLFTELNIRRDLFVPSLFDSVNAAFKITADAKTTSEAGSSANYYAIPYSFDVLVNTKPNFTPQGKPDFIYSLPGSKPELDIAFLASVMQKENISLSLGLSKLKDYSNDDTLQLNPFTYTLNDSLQMVLSGTASTMPMFYSDYYLIKLQYLDQIEIEKIDTAYTVNATCVVFPKSKNNFKNAEIKKTIAVLYEPDIMYATSASRNWIPARIDTVSKNYLSENLKNQLRYVKGCTISGLLYSSESEKQELYDNIRRSLSTRTR